MDINRLRPAVPLSQWRYMDHSGDIGIISGVSVKMAVDARILHLVRDKRDSETGP
ncbi:MAG: hypothetical protein RPU39_13685 [Candidatus Sedimenticola sp. (ex Thyasira tokunagai)]